MSSVFREISYFLRNLRIRFIHKCISQPLLFSTIIIRVKVTKYFIFWLFVTLAYNHHLYLQITSKVCNYHRYQQNINSYLYCLAKILIHEIHRADICIFDARYQTYVDRSTGCLNVLPNISLFYRYPRLLLKKKPLLLGEKSSY